MTRLNVYLPDELAAQAKEAELNVSALTQGAIKRVLRQRLTDTWLLSLPGESTDGVTHDRALQALDAAREEAATPHG